jgi:putative flavoprotein involved in K+ transport
MTTVTDQPLQTADDIATGWLRDLEAALQARDIDAAVDLFATTSFWRDLVSFTWNLRTVENRDGVRDLLAHTLDRVAPTA